MPLSLLRALLWPIALIRSVIELAVQPSRRPPLSLPPRPTTVRRWRFAGLSQRTSAWLNTASLLWADRFTSPPWRDRFSLTALGDLRAILVERPVIIVTVHFGAIFALPSLLRANGIATASVVGPKLWPIRWWRGRRAELTRIDDLPLQLRAGDARAMMRFLRPGRCLLVAADYPQGEQAEGSFDGVTVSLSTPPFRLARLSNAAVVPMIVRSDAVWRYSVHMGRPVPDQVIAAEDYAGAVAHVIGELLPVAAQRPEQALPLLVAAFDDARQPS